MKRIIFFIIFFPLHIFSQEICANGIDDDGDGLIDFNDTLECFCSSNTAIISSLIPNYSFEIMNCCPSAPSQMNCADQWVQASSATSDYFNFCDFGPFFSPPLSPLPGGGNGYVGFYGATNYKEYIGACLNGVLAAGTSYTISLYVAWGSGSLVNDFAIFGTPNCTDLPWGGQDCPVGSGLWQLLENQSVTLVGTGAWQQLFFTFTPTVDIAAIAVGANCGATGSISNYYYLDELLLNESSLFEYATSNGELCTDDLVIHENFTLPIDSLQWFNNGVALIGEVSDSLLANTYGVGVYEVVNFVGSDCKQATFEILPPEIPQAYFNSFFSNGNCLGSPSVFINDTAVSVVDIENWEWDFGDGSPVNNNLNQFYTYANPGTYDVSLVVFSDVGCSDTLVIPATVHPIPISSFEFESGGVLFQPSQDDTITVCGLNTISFQNLSTIQSPGIIANSEWDFGDLSISNVVNPNHIYGTLGYYNIELKSTSDFGCESQFSCVIFIAPNPVADFNNGLTCENHMTNFISSTSLLAGSLVNFNWDFDDGTILNSSNTNINHVFNTVNSYNVQLVATSDEGCTDTIVKVHELSPAPLVNFSILNHCELDSIIFVNLSTINALATLTNWEWDFGDGTVSTAEDFTHYYSAIGLYNIKLKAYSNFGCVDSISFQHIIDANPVIDILIEDACENETIVFQNNNTIANGIIQNYNWNLGDGTFSTDIEPQMSYAQDSIYSIVLELESDEGCLTLDSTEITIFNTPIAELLIGPQFGCGPIDIDLANAVNEDVYECEWHLGDGNIEYGCGNINHVYNAGEFDLFLKVSSENGCSDSLLKSNFIKVDPTPIADFVFSPSLVTITNSEVQFLNQSTNAYSYEWNFGDYSNTVNEINPGYNYPSIPKEYNVLLTATNFENTCVDTKSKILSIADEVIYYVPNAFTPSSNGINDQFSPIIKSGIEIYDYKLTVFNRWGEVIFISYDPSIGWDGNLISGEVVQNGIYIWQLEFGITNEDKRITDRGFVNLIK